MMYAIIIPPDYTWLRHLAHGLLVLVRKLYKKDERMMTAEISMEDSDDEQQS